MELFCCITTTPQYLPSAALGVVQLIKLDLIHPPMQNSSFYSASSVWLIFKNEAEQQSDILEEKKP